MIPLYCPYCHVKLKFVKTIRKGYFIRFMEGCKIFNCDCDSKEEKWLLDLKGDWYFRQEFNKKQGCYNLKSIEYPKPRRFIFR